MTDDKKRLTSGERDAVLRLCAALAIIGTEPDNVKHRLSDLPYIKRDLGHMRNTITKMVEHIVKSIPDNQIKALKRDISSTTYTVSVKNVTTTDEHNQKNAIMSLSYDTIYALIEGCHDKCLMCSLDKGQRRACRLKKALDDVPNNIKEPIDGDCPYYGVV